MSKYLGPKLKILKKLGILLPALTTKTLYPNINSNLKRLSISDDYKLKLIEKQKLKYNYNLTDTKLKQYYFKAKKKKGSTENILMNYLESRLDNIVFRLGFAVTIIEARQYINHCHILVNNKIINIASYNCKLNDIISIKNTVKSKKLILKNVNNFLKKYDLIKIRLKKINLYNFYFYTPSYVLYDNIKNIGKIISTKKYIDIQLNVDELKIIEYYSY